MFRTWGAINDPESIERGFFRVEWPAGQHMVWIWLPSPFQLIRSSAEIVPCACGTRAQHKHHLQSRGADPLTLPPWGRQDSQVVQGLFQGTRGFKEGVWTGCLARVQRMQEHESHTYMLVVGWGWRAARRKEVTACSSHPPCTA